jgi:hypothetical protein
LTLLTVAPASAGAQGLPADDEIVLPGRAPAPPAEGREPPARVEPERSGARPTRPTARAERRRRGRRPGRASRAHRATGGLQPSGVDAAATDDLDAAVDEDAEAARLEEEGIEYEVRQEMEWEDRRRREREERGARRPPEVADREEPAPVVSEDGQVRDEELIRPPRRRRERERGESEARRSAGAAADLVSLEVGVSASTREQTIDVPDGSTIHFGLTPFASAFGSVVLTPFARLDGGLRGLGVALSYDRAIRMEAVTDDQVLAASADHLAAMLLYRFLLPGRVRIEPRIGYDLARFLLAPNETLPGIVYESIALGGQVQIPIMRDPRTGSDRLRVRLGGAMYFPIGLGEAAARYGQSGTARGFAFEGGVEGTVSGLFGYFALLRHTSYTATFHSPEATGETTSEDGMTTGLCGGSVRF